jgi:hypothetical protein
MDESIAVGSIDPGLVTESRAMLALAVCYDIVSPEMREAASFDLKNVKALYKQVDEQEKAITRPINEGLKRVRAMFAQPKEWLSNAETTLKGECLRWDSAESRKRAEAAAEAARIADAERQRLEAAAKREAEAGNAETAVAIAQAAAFVAPAPVVEAPKLAGESTREQWSAECVDIVELCRGVVEGKNPPESVLPNMVFWNGAARSFKKSFAFPGMRAIAKQILASRSA